MPSVTFSPQDLVQAPYTVDGSIKQQSVYQRLSSSKRQQLWNEDQTGLPQKQLDEFNRLLVAWKESSDPEKYTAPLLKALYKRAFDIDAPVRTPDGVSKFETQKNITETLAEFRDHSKELFGYLYSDNFELYRGIWDLPAYQILMQAIDNLDRDRFKLKNVVANYTVVPRVAFDYSQEVVIQQRLPRDRVLMAVDQLRSGDRPSEGEVHVQGGILEVPPEAVYFTPVDEDHRRIKYQRQSSELTSRMASPKSLPLIAHQTLLDHLELAAAKPVTVGTPSGKERIKECYDHLRKRGLVPSEEQEYYKKLIEIVSTIDTDAHWV